MIAGPRLFFAGKALSQTGGHGDFRSPQSIDPCACAYNGALTKVVDGADEVRKAVREELRRGASQIKLMLPGGVLSPADPIWMPQFTDAEISAAVEEAGTRRSYVTAHAHTSEAALRCVKPGIRSIEHGTLIDAKTAREIAKHDAYVVPTLAIGNNILKSNEVSGRSDAMLEKAKAMRNQAIGAVETCYKAGALADLIVLDGNPLEDISVLADANKYLALVMKAGRIYRNKLNRE